MKRMIHAPDWSFAPDWAESLVVQIHWHGDSTTNYRCEEVYYSDTPRPQADESEPVKYCRNCGYFYVQPSDWPCSDCYTHHPHPRHTSLRLEDIVLKPGMVVKVSAGRGINSGTYTVYSWGNGVECLVDKASFEVVAKFKRGLTVDGLKQYEIEITRIVAVKEEK